MPYQADSFGEALRKARLQKGWSQRDLSRLVGMPQAQISKIESGAVDPRLTTLVQLARLLDLEPVLTPRAALPAVQAIVREAAADDPARAVREAANILSATADRLQRARPGDASAGRLMSLSSDLAVLAPHSMAPAAASQLLQLARDIQAAADDGSSRLERSIGRLADLRNTLAHRGPRETRPAYTLDDED